MNMRRTVIRRAQPGDVDRLSVLEIRAFSSYYARHRFTAQQFRYYLRRSHTIAYVAESGEALDGYVLGIHRRGKSRQPARLLSIAVEPGAQGHGVGQRLLRVFIRDARHRHCNAVFLEVASVNTPARELFRRHGFRKVRTLPGYYSPRVDGIRMRLSIV
jgi:ribosomal protein S18 acetylase RimI-like enzyme